MGRIVNSTRPPEAASGTTTTSTLAAIVGEGPGDGFGHRRQRHQAGRFGFPAGPSVAGEHPPFPIHEQGWAGETRQHIARIEKHAQGVFFWT
ncbi:MAG: hypothetical protein IH904_02340 [Proteobacteria bacterium]|nr:hypothetical protein [Pseudomonadota bacterium]